MEVGKKPEIYLYRLAEHENIENAWASLAWTPYGPQTRLIVYNSQWFQRSAGENRSYYGEWVAWVFYHETGHHICGHVPGDGSKPWKELEADQAAGAFLAREKNHPYQL